MDLAAGARQVRVLTLHNPKAGAPKLVKRITLPATGRGVVGRVYTDIAVLDPEGNGFRLVDLAPRITLADVLQRTGAPVFAG